MTPTSDFDAMRTKFKEWTKIHVDIYWDILQSKQKVLNLGSGYGFFEEEINNREEKKFEIEGDEIGQFRLANYVGGVVHTVNFATEPIPEKMVGKYDLVMALHLLEHMNKPVDYLRNLKPLLKPQGKIIIEVPNLDSCLCELSPVYSEFFYLYDMSMYHILQSLH